MSKQTSRTQQVRGRCRCCGQPEVTREHIWNQWTWKALPKLKGKRREEVRGLLDELGNPLPEVVRFKEGDVRTKVSRKFCSKCNGGWMREIGEAAKPYAVRLIKGQQIDLTSKEQEALATWIALCSLVADIEAQSRHKFPQGDLEYLSKHRKPPPHWYVGIGCYGGPVANYSGCDHSPFSIEHQVTGERETLFVVHSVSWVIGQLYTCTQAISPPQMGNPQLGPIKENGPYVTPIFPHLSAVIRFPPHPLLRVTGFLAPGGGLVRHLSRKYPGKIASDVNKMLGASKRD